VCTCCASFPKNMMMMYQQFPRIRYVSPGVVPVPTCCPCCFVVSSLVIRVLSASMYLCMCVSMCSFALFNFALLAGSLRSLSTKSFMVLPLPPSKTNTSYKAWGDAVRWLRMRQMWSLSYPGMRASPRQLVEC